MSKKEIMEDSNLSRDEIDRIIAMMMYIEGKSGDVSTRIKKVMKDIHPAILPEQKPVLESQKNSG